MAFLDEQGIQKMTANIKTLADDTYLAKIGGTMIGQLTFSRGNYIRMNTSLDDATLCSSRSVSKYICGISTNDSNDNNIFYSETALPTDGSVYRSFIVRAQDSNGNEYLNGFYVRIKNDGSPQISFTSNAVRKAWCSGLGVGDYVSKTLGSSGTQSVAHNTTVNLTNIALDPGVWVVMGKVSFATGGSTVSGYRSCYIGSSTSNDTYASQQLPGATGGNTAVAAMGLITLSAASTVYLNAKQYSGSALNVNKAYTYIQAVRIRADV